ncbi:MAG TPA: hypothetical protein VKT82_16070 [Ktedonobacterales bacterium]|nr:hypothetical protein [Ktedonobacterales bacterium]
MSRFRISGGIVVFLALIIVGVGFLGGSAVANSKPPAPPPTHKPFQISQTYLPGSPGIKLRTAPNTSGPAFTQADVTTYFQKHGFLPLAPGAHLQILSIQFVSAKQASDLMAGESVGRPDNYLVCFVKVKGPFLTSTLHVPPGANLPPTAEYGHDVFDAHTGNELVWGVNFS